MDFRWGSAETHFQQMAAIRPNKKNFGQTAPEGSRGRRKWTGRLTLLYEKKIRLVPNLPQPWASPITKERAIRDQERPGSFSTTSKPPWGPLPPVM